MATERQSDEEARRRAEQARRDRQGVLEEVAYQRAMNNMGRGHSSELDSIVAGLIQGLGFGWGDELLGGAMDFEGARGQHQGLYDLASILGTGVLGTVVTRAPLRDRERLFNEARDALGAQGVAQREIPMPRQGNFQDSVPYAPAQADIDALTTHGDLGGARRLELDRADALGRTEELLALRRGALDSYSGLDAAAHGAVIGSGGVEPGDTSLEERATGGVLGALGAYGLTRASGEIKDLSGYPIRGARWSAQDVVDLPGPRNAQPDLDAFINRARMFEEQAFRDRTGDTFFGRAAGPSPTMRENPNVALLDDQNPLIRAAIARAQESATGANAARALDEEIDIGRALENFGGMRAPMPAPNPNDPPLLPSHVRDNLPAALRSDAPMRADGLRTVMGDERYFPDAQGRGGVDPALRSDRQIDDLQRGRVNPRQYPGMDKPQRRELAHLIAQDAFAQGMKLAQLPRAEQPAAARKLLAYLDDPRTRRLMQNLQLREGRTSDIVKRHMELREGLKRVAAHGGDFNAITEKFGRGRGKGAEPPVAEAAHMLSNYPMSRRLAEALLDEQTLTTPREAYWVNPAERGDESLLQVRRESVKPPWPYRAPAGVGTQLAGDMLALGLDHAQHAALGELWDQRSR